MSINTCKINEIPEKVLNDTLDVMILLSMSWFGIGLMFGFWLFFMIGSRFKLKKCDCSQSI
ncbi:hypothetical protein [Moraxella sp. ZY210820]|uniref:hypothetical protein n=1 Tax=unclassified Moraxella TaxID=2685852 RepID=UPI0027311743|nr:hypothetical protein [Moraxella sp. ZY210820]WLF82873.1 hypothetical protein LU301_06155 [Moraxella sp. ZY210820]